MQRCKVEFRICYGSVGVFEAERVALALIHWDGRKLRAAARKNLPAVFEQTRGNLERTLRSFMRTAHKAPQLVGLGLDAAFPVREGEATGAWWSPLRIGHTSDAQRHFDDLAKSLRLVSMSTRATPDITRPRVDNDLATVRERLLAQHPDAADRIAVDYRVHGPTREYASPLSWRIDGSWSHTLAVVPSLSTAPDPMSEVLAVRQLHVPAQDELVVVYPLVGEPSVLSQLERDLRFVSQRADARLRTLGLPLQLGHVDVAPVERLVSEDLAA